MASVWGEKDVFQRLNKEGTGLFLAPPMRNLYNKNFLLLVSFGLCDLRQVISPYVKLGVKQDDG